MRLLGGSLRNYLGYNEVYSSFSPDSVANLALWLKADEGTYQDSSFSVLASQDGDVVGGWQDQSGNSRDAIQTTTASKPTFRTNVLNGRPVIRFDGIQSHLNVQNFTNSASNYTVFVVYDPTNITGVSEYLIDIQTGRLILAHTDANSVLDDSGWFDGTWREVAPATNAKQILTFRLDSGGATLRRNGSVIGSAGYTQRAVGGTVRIGADRATPTFGSILADIGEILIYTRSLVIATEIDPIEEYLATRWGVTL